MNSTKEEIITFLKERQFLSDNVYFKDPSDETDYNDLINLFKKWCKFLDYPINYNSLYYFFLESGEPVYVSGNTLFFKDRLIMCKEYIYEIYYNELIEKGYDKL